MNTTQSVILERSFVPVGTVILKEGQPGSSAYLIQSGAVEVFTMNGDREVVLARLGVGQIFGEMALVFDEKRSASVRAMDDCNLIVITRQSFQSKLNKTNPTIRAIVQMLAQRIASANNILVNKQSDVESMRETTQIIYQNIHLRLPESRKRAFQDGVLPKLEALLAVLDEFDQKHG